MREDALRQRDPRRHQEGRPVDGVEAHDVLADDVQVGRPEMRARIRVVGKAGGRQIVGQRVDPDVHHVPLVAGDPDAPVERVARDRQVLEPALDEAHHLVPPLLRADEGRIRLVMRKQPVLIGGEAEEVGLLLRPFDRRAERLPAHAVRPERRLLLVEIGFLPHRVPAGILVEIDVAGRLHAPPDLLAGKVVPLLGGADEVVLRDVERRRHVAKALRVAVGELDRRQPLGDRRLLHLEAVLVGARQEEHVLAVEPLEARDRIARHRRIGMADMGDPIRIEDRRGEVEARLLGHDGIRKSTAYSGFRTGEGRQRCVSRRSSTNCLRSRL